MRAFMSDRGERDLNSCGIWAHAESDYPAVQALTARELEAEDATYEAERIMGETEWHGQVLAPIVRTYHNPPETWNGHEYAGLLDPAFRHCREALTEALTDILPELDRLARETR
jgi:hypothetical protein